MEAVTVADIEALEPSGAVKEPLELALRLVPSDDPVSEVPEKSKVPLTLPAESTVPVRVDVTVRGDENPVMVQL